MVEILVAVALIALHDVDGSVVYINPEHITLLYPTHEGARSGRPNELIAKGVNCVVGLANGKRVSAIEDCDTISKLMEVAR